MSERDTQPDDEGVDPDFDFRTDRPAGKDPDSWSATLRKYHRFLWSKPLPGGEVFDLTEAGKSGGYHLRHESALGLFSSAATRSPTASSKPRS